MSSRQVKCPRCGKLSLFSPENPSRPFCSDRCKLIDLGQWADEKYAIPIKPASEADLLDHLDELGEGEEEGHDYSSTDTPNDTTDASSDGRIH